MTKTKYLWATLSCTLFLLPLSAQQKKLQSLPYQSQIIAHGWQSENMVTYNADGYCRWWTNDGICRDSFACLLSNVPKSVATFTKNSNFLLLQTSDSTFGVWDIPARMQIYEEKIKGSGLKVIAISPNNQYSAVAYREGVVVYDSTGAEAVRFAHDKTPISLAVSDLGMTMVGYQENEDAIVITKTWGPQTYKSFAQSGETRARGKTKGRNQASELSESELHESIDATTKTSEYGVCVGTFGTEVNAQRRLDDAKDWGFTAAKIIISGDKYIVFADFYPKYDLAWKIKKQLEDQYNVHTAVVRRKD
jgi:hypothetical protein